MKILLVLIFSISSLWAQVQAKPDKYELYLQSIQKDMETLGMQVDVNTPNPFITGTALQNYFLNEKVLLLERDAYFMLKSNKLETTEDVADYQHRLKVLKNHAINIMLGLVRSLKNAKNDDLGKVEAQKQKVAWEDLIAECKNNEDCVSKKLSSGEIIVTNDLIDTFEFSIKLSEQVPYMNAVEFSSIFMLVQLLQVEGILGNSRIANVEFDLFIKKQKSLIDAINKNVQMTQKEKEFNHTMVMNVVNKWKKKILERKFDQKDKFKILRDKIHANNLNIIKTLDEMRTKNPEIMSEQEICRRFMRINRDRKNCELRAKLEEKIQNIKNNENRFIGSSEKKLPQSFFETL